jgi:hypothetical protein
LEALVRVALSVVATLLIAAAAGLPTRAAADVTDGAGPVLATVPPAAGLPAAAPVPAQAEQIRVFIDCDWHCDMDFIRTEISWVDYMRDRADAQVHVLVTAQATGGGGRRYTLGFIGLREFAGRADTLVYTATSEDTQDLVRRGLTNTIRIGLVRYVANTPLANRLTIGIADPPRTPGAAAAAAAQAHDPWNFWTFRIGMNGYGNGESRQQFYNASGSLSANRTTEDWKISLSSSGSYNEQNFELSNDVKIKSVTRRYSGSGLVVRSVTPHLSVGGRAGASTSTFGNILLSLSLTPAVEYNFFDYAEATRRQFTVRYGAGVRYFDYRDVTIFGQMDETRPIHTLDVGYATRQPWGGIDVGASASQYLHDTSRYNANLGGGVSDIRLFKGFSFNLYGNYARVKDQLALPAGNLTPEQILLRQRELDTTYRFFMNVGLSYRFGSIFNNVVNPRFGGSSGGQTVIMF